VLVLMVLEKRKSLTHSTIQTPDHTTITFLQKLYYLSRSTDSIYTYFVIKFCIVPIFLVYFFIKYYVSTSKGSLVDYHKTESYANNMYHHSVVILHSTRQAMYVYRNVLSCDHCCSGKAVLHILYVSL